MSKNKSVRKELERLYGKECFIDKLHLRKDKQQYKGKAQYKRMKQLLSDRQFPNAIICGNDAVANSIIQAINESKYSEQIIIAGQDADIVNCQHIVTGKQTVTIYKPITELSKQTAYAAVRLAKGTAAKDLEDVNAVIFNGSSEVPSILLEPIPVTKDNIDEIIIESGFHTREEVYRK